MVPTESNMSDRQTPSGTIVRTLLLLRGGLSFEIASSSESVPNAFPAILGKLMAAAIAPLMSSTCAAVPRISCRVKYRAQNRIIVVGETQYSKNFAIPASRKARGERMHLSHLKCLRAGHCANHERQVSSFRPSWKI